MTCAESSNVGQIRDRSVFRSGLNGSDDLLAIAMREVFGEAAEEAVEPLTSDVGDMEGRFNICIDATNRNMYAQFAAQQAVTGEPIKDQTAA